MTNGATAALKKAAAVAPFFIVIINIFLKNSLSKVILAALKISRYLKCI